LPLVAGGLRASAQGAFGPNEEWRETNEPPHKFGEIVIPYIVRTRLILALIHGAVHARLEEGLGGCVGSRSNKLIELVDIALEIAPEEGRLALGLARTKLEFFADEEYALFVG
jgi:hypothetical protein